jgi:hypothetical protein
LRNTVHINSEFAFLVKVLMYNTLAEYILSTNSLASEFDSWDLSVFSDRGKPFLSAHKLNPQAFLAQKLIMSGVAALPCTHAPFQSPRF